VSKKTLAFWSVAYLLFILMLGSTMPSPLYVVYQRLWHFPAGTITLIYGVYALGVLVSLLVFGHLSDHIGRRRVLIPAVLLMAISALFFMFAQNVLWLIIGRILMGLSVGLNTGTAAAAMQDLHPRGNTRAASLVVSMCTVLGLGLGPILSSLFVQFTSHPGVYAFLVLLVLLVGAFLGGWTIPQPRAFSLHNVFSRPHFPLRHPLFVLAIATIFACYATMGMTSSLVPSFLISLLHVNNSVLGGGMLCLMFMSASVVQLLLRGVPHRFSISGGLIILTLGLIILVGSFPLQSLWLFFLSIIIIGIGQGLSFMGSAAIVTHIASPEKRSATSSAYFAIGYVAVGVPVIGLGLMANTLGLLPATTGFVVIFSIFSLIVALAGLLINRRGKLQDAVAA
jgi:MFS family permease